MISSIAITYLVGGSLIHEYEDNLDELSLLIKIRSESSSDDEAVGMER